jgi:hypothetical protein
VCRLAILGVVVMPALVAPTIAAAPKFLPDDPIRLEPDPADASRVQPFPIHLSWDLISSVITKHGDRSTGRADDVNTIDEVPDSSWFTNRVGTRTMTAADVARGPDTTDGPVGRWTIVAGKSEGVRPGFTVKDAAGVTWFVKFDAPGYPEQATGAEVVSTKLFWALGYDVAETHVARMHRDELSIAPSATITVHGRKRSMTWADVDRILALVDRSPDGTSRALASKTLEGKPIGEFLYYGTRSDDPNDVVPHENRRELRAMGVFAAWIDRVDAKAGNTLDTLVTHDGKSVVHHHPLDFGSTLGSGGIAPNAWWEGYESLSGTSVGRKMLGFGLPIESWRTIDYPTIRGVGRIEGDHFDPRTWRSRVPNAAYIRADPDDTFWAARKLIAVSDAMIAAAVHAGAYSDTAAESYLSQTLIKRRNAILLSYLPAVNPIADLALTPEGALTFDNAAVMADVAVAPRAYRATWYTFDNLGGDSTFLGATESRQPTMNSPAMLSDTAGLFVRVDVVADSADHPSWSVPLHAYFRRDARGWTLVGLDRT